MAGRSEGTMEMAAGAETARTGAEGAVHAAARGETSVGAGAVSSARSSWVEKEF